MNLLSAPGLRLNSLDVQHTCNSEQHSQAFKAEIRRVFTRMLEKDTAYIADEDGSPMVQFDREPRFAKKRSGNRDVLEDANDHPQALQDDEEGEGDEEEEQSFEEIAEEHSDHEYLRPVAALAGAEPDEESLAAHRHLDGAAMRELKAALSISSDELVPDSQEDLASGNGQDHCHQTAGSSTMMESAYGMAPTVLSHPDPCPALISKKPAFVEDMASAPRT